jgi:flagellin-like protein
MSKGVTPVVATVLLIAVTVASAGTVYTLMQETTSGTKDKISDTDLGLAIEKLSIEKCYRDNKDYVNIDIRNSATKAINASDVTPLLNGSVQADHKVSQEIVNPKRTFTLNTSAKFNSETLVILTSGENQIRHRCLDL